MPCACGCGREQTPGRLFISGHNRRMPLMDRFWKMVEKTETCWLWKGSILQGTGYGSFTITNPDGSIRSLSAHRFAYETLVGPIGPRQFVCHRCDVRRCVRPEHLFLGSHRENVADMLAKGRGSIGEARPNAKLTTRAVVAIRNLYSRGATQKDLSEKYSVNQTTIHNIVRGRQWRHVGGKIVTRNMRTKLSDSQVSAIRLRHSLGVIGPTKLAAMYGVDRQTIWRIVTWRERRDVH